MLLTSTDSASCLDAETDLSACRDRLRVGSRSFHAAAFLFPSHFRQPASALYAFCRAADDAVDDSDDARSALRMMHRRLDAIYAGQPEDHAADRALTEVVTHFDLPKPLLEALFEGFAWDVEGRRYADLSEVRAYSARVAGAVGAMMAVLMGVRDPQLLARASDLGVAMQLTNIARDVGEDARAGRLYLPQYWLAEAGIDADAFLENPCFTPALGSVIQRLLAEAQRLYARADSGIVHLPRRCRPAIYAARLLYAEIGGEVARQGYDSISRRAVVSASRKVRVLASGLARLTWLGDASLNAPVLDETQFLVGAAEDLDQTLVTKPRLGMLAKAERNAIWVLDLFEELERRERQQAKRSELTDEAAA